METPVSAGSAALELRGAAVSYGRLRALAPTDLAVASGELVALLGPNGAGKTTLLRVMSGLLAPTAGEARLFAKPMVEIDRREVARRVAVVQQHESVAFDFTVEEVVAMGRAPHQAGGWMRLAERDREAVRAAMERCDVVPLAKRTASALSGGEQRRVFIARALAQEPRVLLLDEPAASLDVRHQIELHELLRDEVSRTGLACVVAMHDLNAAAMYATRVVLMKEGGIVAAGSVQDVMTYARLKDTFDADLYVGVNDVTGDRFFLPMRR